MNVNLELTDRCNIKCLMCSQSMRDEAHGQPMRWMDFATWRAAVQGHPSGQLALGRCYLSGEGVQRCSRRAIEWLERAAAQGADENVAAAWAADELAALMRDAEPVK